MRADLAGDNLVRLLYLDEAGTDHTAPVVGVGGVVIHGDQDWPKIDERIRELIDRYVKEPELREGFIFHATDIYHGSKYFDRRKPEWADREKRNTVLTELVAILRDLNLPVVFGRYERANPLYRSGMRPNVSNEELTNFLHQMAASDCLSQTDKWLAAYAPNELATVVHEDGTPAKGLIKRTVKVLRSPKQMERSGLEDNLKRDFSFPLKRIIDTVHFAEKAEARPLQLADLVAFVFSRVLSQKHMPQDVLKMLLAQVTWLRDPSLRPPKPETTS